MYRFPFWDTCSVAVTTRARTHDEIETYDWSRECKYGNR